MKKFKAYFFLLLIVGVQFGSTGFTYYVNECSASGNTFMTFSYVGCHCTHNILNTEKGFRDTLLKKKCCSSTEFFIDTADDYPSASNVSTSPVFFDNLMVHNYLGMQEPIFIKITQGKYANPPPWQDYNKLIFIQFFLI